MTPNVFEYNDPVEFLNAAWSAIQASNPQFSLRAWAKQLELKHVSILSLVMHRKRRLLPNLSTKISRSLLKSGRFNETQARYFDILVLFSLAATQDEKLFYQNILSSLKPDRQFSTLALDQVRFISDWYHLAILEMTELKNFESDPRWISLRLGSDVNAQQAKEATDRLIRLGLLERTSDGRLRKTLTHYASSTDVPNESLRKFHSQMIQKALGALETQAVKDREISSYTLSISKEKIPEAKQMIRDFRRKLGEFLETPQGDSVYQINVQMFDLLGGPDVRPNVRQDS